MQILRPQKWNVQYYTNVLIFALLLILLNVFALQLTYTHLPHNITDRLQINKIAYSQPKARIFTVFFEVVRLTSEVGWK